MSFTVAPDLMPKPAVDVSEPPFALADDQIVSLYRELKSIWKVGERLGISGQKVHQRLNSVGVDTSRPPEFTTEQVQTIEFYYRNTPNESFDLAALAATVGKSRHNVARLARKLGLTNRSRPIKDEARKRAAARQRARLRDGAHPRGMLGKKHSPETLAKVAAAARKSWATWKSFGTGLMSEEHREMRRARMAKITSSRPAETMHTRAKGGRRPDLGDIFFRSAWEANYARYLNFLKKLGAVEEWKFEPEVFWFEGIRRGVTNYKPDFWVKFKGDPHPEYHEIKGWIVAKDRTKWARMAKYHPTVKLVIIAPKQYYGIERKFASCIPEWEGRRG